MMIAIAILSWFLYAIALVMKSYANRVRFMSFLDMPSAFSRSPGFASKFWLRRLAFTYASLAGLWFAHGWRVLVGAFLFYLMFCFVTFVKGSRHEVNKWARVNFEMKKEDAEQKGESFDETSEWFQSWKLTKKRVEQQIRRNGNL